MLFLCAVKTGKHSSAELRLDPVRFVPLTFDDVPFIICSYCIHLSIRYRFFVPIDCRVHRMQCTESDGTATDSIRQIVFLTKRTSYRTSCRGMFSKTCPIYLQLRVWCTLGSFETPAMLPHVHVLEQACLEQRQRLQLDAAGDAYYEISANRHRRQHLFKIMYMIQDLCFGVWFHIYSGLLPNHS